MKKNNITPMGKKVGKSVLGYPASLLARKPSNRPLEQTQNYTDNHCQEA